MKGRHIKRKRMQISQFPARREGHIIMGSHITGWSHIIGRGLSIEREGDMSLGGVIS